MSVRRTAAAADARVAQTGRVAYADRMAASLCAMPPRARLECQRCLPVKPGGAADVAVHYDRHQDAIDDMGIDARRKKGADWVEDAPCGICGEKLSDVGDYDEEDDSVEALIEDTRLNVCNHIFHTACLRTAIASGRRTCPVCRTPIKQSVFDSAAFADLNAKENQRDPLNPEGNAVGIPEDFLDGAEESEEDLSDSESFDQVDEDDNEETAELKASIDTIRKVFHGAEERDEEERAILQFKQSVDGREPLDEEDEDLPHFYDVALDFAKELLNKLEGEESGTDETHFEIFLLVLQIVGAKLGMRFMVGIFGDEGDIDNWGREGVHRGFPVKRERLVDAFEAAYFYYAEDDEATQLGPTWDKYKAQQWGDADSELAWDERKSYILLEPSLRLKYYANEDEDVIAEWLADEETAILTEEERVQEEEEEDSDEDSDEDDSDED